MSLLQSSDLNNSAIFRPFSELPSEHEFSETYLSYTKPRKHWCFLGKIVKCNFLVRLTLDVEDKKGHRFLVAFHTDDRGAAFKAMCIPGNTIAVLYAAQHTFAFSPPGLRIEEDGRVMVFPYSLEKMLAVSNDVLQRAKAGTCETCGAVENSMKKCARCKTALYCSRECQTNGWASHKDRCAITKDLLWFMQRDWESSSNAHLFPAGRY
ncbi:hypothetical protein F5I97DRAFT_1235524 [Phlebopus sp. FC_14]|nr:hypothetical protein F5I97DRAFT_1235524 [Phlebopus sp. FC_14]